MTKIIEWHDFPLPPSANHLYKTIMIKGRIRRCKAKEYAEFEKKALDWKNVNHIDVGLFQANLEFIDVFRGEHLERNGHGTVIHIECEFRFERSRLFNKLGNPKKLDSANYLKALHDAVSEIIGIDDKYFWSGTFSKKAVASVDEEGVRITFYAKNLSDV